MAHRQQRMRATLERSSTVTEAIYAAGFNSSGRFCGLLAGARHDAGRVPVGRRECRDQVRDRPMLAGLDLVAASEKGVCAIMLGDDPDALLADLQAGSARG